MENLAPERVIHPMPETAAFIAKLKAAFGEDEMDEAIRRGKAGEPTFHASENGRTVGTASAASNNVWKADNAVRDRHYCRGCDGSCIGKEIPCRR